MAPTALLDLDGTLIDSQPGIVASCEAMLRALGHAGEAPDIRGYIGPPLEEMIAGVLHARGDDRVAEGVAAYRRYYGETGLFGAEAYPGIGAALRDLRGAGVRLFVATSKREVFARRILEALKLANLFDGVYGSIPGGALDQKPALLAHIVAEQKITPERAVMVGDRRYDIAGARAVGMRGLGVLWGFGAREELEAAGADGLVARAADLADAVLDMLDMAAPKNSR
jgi:phosphoglycolate phosphatase